MNSANPAGGTRPETRRRRLAPALRRGELLEVGEALIRAGGAAVCAEDVTRAAGAAKGTFYVYFASWEVFLLALRARAFVQLDRDLDSGLAGHADWEDLISGLPDLFIGLTLSLEGLHGVLFHGALREIPPARSEPDILARLRALLASGRAQGGLEVEDLGMAVRFTFGLLHEAADLAAAGAERGRVAKAFGAYLARSLQATPAPVTGTRLTPPG